MMKIVVVEDEHNSREGLVRLIGKLEQSYEVVGEAENGADGIALIERTKPDLVITDIKMPGISGLEMLSALKNKGYRHKMIILTGYSEFEYAQKALKMSVSDYLEKPITVPDLQEALAKVKAELLEKQLERTAPEEEGNLAAMCQRLMDADGEDTERLEARIRTAMGVREGVPLHIAVFSYDRHQTAQPMNIKVKLETLWKEAGVSVALGVASRGLFVSIVHPTAEGFDTRNYINQHILPEMERSGIAAVCCLGETAQLSGLNKEMEKLFKLAKWSMILGSQQAICQADVDHLRLRALPYPSALERNCSRAIVLASGSEIEKQFPMWTHEFMYVKYGPVLTIEYAIRFVSYMLRLASDVHGFTLPEPFQSEWLRSLREVRTLQEYVRIMTEIASKLKGIASPADTPVYSLLVQKAVRMIQERYTEGITLDEIAGHLHITTAYLSGQFNREVRQPFSTYIKDLRLKKAKELLLGSDYRAFEIAQKVGYPDPKYFSRVFKAATGMSPGEYQKYNAK